MASKDRPQGMTPRSSASSGTREPWGLTSRGMDPFTQFRRLTDQMERWFEGIGVRGSDRATDMGVTLWAPEIETFMRDDQFVVRADLPGLNKDEVNVEVTDDSLVLHGERQKSHEEERDGFYRSERSYGRFYREIPLPEGALAETAQANFKDGVLEITLTAPPREVTKPRRIEIGGTSSTKGTETSTGKTANRNRAVARDTE
jgi:HSP20 family protein